MLIWFQPVMVKLVWSSLFQRVVWLDNQLSSCQWLVVTVSWNHTFDQSPLIPGEIGGRHHGALVSIDAGKATTYSIMSIEERGTIFVNPGTGLQKEWSSVKTLVRTTWQLTSLRPNKWPTFVLQPRTKQLLSRHHVSWHISWVLEWRWVHGSNAWVYPFA